ncbi:YibE/F family protein [Priestia megaterium]|uniref:YibE/F family protein n=1 Tax=Priestia megaterium TaxID=1404 RepID=UPI000E2F4C7F|nr:YibE/F family protein [Priestia megaterium]MCM3187055.1 YibE/F family protein [Priestia megaterium]MCM3194830.1 YibE/F family protein [Priestia megaterium]MCM3543529.1 YibE/F family protein [Priestia megaterium]
MNALVILSLILLVLMILIGGYRGMRSFISLFLNFGVLMFTIFLMLGPQMNPVIITLISCAIISCINLFFINNVDRKTGTAFLSTIVTIVLLIVLIEVIVNVSMIQGYGEEETEELAVFSLFVGIDFVKIGASVMIISTIGAITEVAISITSSMGETMKQHPSISRKDLFLSGMRIGKDILGTDTNTLFFAFFGGYLALLIWFKDLHYSIGAIVNSKIFGAEMMTIFFAGIGVALIIPITAWINTYFSVKAREKALKESKEN